MTWDAVTNIFQGVTTLADAFSHNPKMAIARMMIPQTSLANPNPFHFNLTSAAAAFTTVAIISQPV